VVLTGTRWALPVYALCKIVQFAFPAFWVVAVEQRRLSLLRWPGRPGRPGAWIGFGSGVAFLALLAVARPALLRLAAAAGAPAAVAAKLAAFGIRDLSGYLALAVFYAACHSLLEEYYWRWFLFRHLRRRLPVSAAILLSSLAFAAHHVLVVGQLLGGYDATTWLLAGAVALGGAVWAWAYHESGSLYGPWLGHALADAGLLWLGWQIWRVGGA